MGTVGFPSGLLQNQGATLQIQGDVGHKYRRNRVYAAIIALQRNGDSNWEGHKMTKIPAPSGGGRCANCVKRHKLFPFLEKYGKHFLASDNTWLRLQHFELRV